MELWADIKAFILQHEQDSLASLALTLSKKTDLPKQFILDQINGRQKARKKFPSLLSHSDYLFPTAKSVEQASSETTAAYKSEIVQADRILDLSGGMGMDTYFFSKGAKLIDYVEPNEKLCELNRQNFKTLGADQIKIHHSDAETFLRDNQTLYDLIYLDPDRRALKSGAFRLEDCEPQLLEILPELWKRTEQILLKLSPMLDLKEGLRQLPNCSEVHVVSVINDCKELLFLLKKGNKAPSKLKTINIRKKKVEHFDFSLDDEINSAVIYGDPENFLYEPNASILKAGAFKSIAAKFGLKKVAPNTHLYCSDQFISDFPGRRIRIHQIASPKKGLITQANIICRNYPMKPETLKSKFKIKDGGNSYLYACRLANNRSTWLIGELIK